MNALRRLAALSLGTLFVIALGSAQGQAPATAPATAALPAAPAQATPGGAVTAKSAAGELPAQLFADPAAATNQAAAAVPADPKKQERLQKIRQLTFDRRPTAILKAWSTPREEAIKNGFEPVNGGRGWRCCWAGQDGSAGRQRRRGDNDSPKCRDNSRRRVHHAAGLRPRERSARPI